MSKQEQIIKAAADLFAEKSYDSVGIREIANTAGVNSAMISYYFKGKLGLLREIFTRFSNLLNNEARRAIDHAQTSHEMCELFVRNALQNARENRSLYIVGLKELNRDAPEMRDLRDYFLADGREHYMENMERLGIRDHVSEDQSGMGFIIILGTVFSDYLLGGGQYIDNEDKTEEYAKDVIGILQHGLPKYWS